MPKVPFKVSARTAKLIGLENFSNEEGAIIELVKNSYDANASNCIIIFDIQNKTIQNRIGFDIQVIDRENSHIYIIDNGVGMTSDIISNQWMTIGTDHKLENNASNGERVKTGAKGIGRFALNRLGVRTNLFTKSIEQESCIEWTVDWRAFDIKGATVSDVEADITDLEALDLNDKLLQKYGNHDKWRQLFDSIDFRSGTIIEISVLNDNWEEDQIKKLYANLEMLLPPIEQNDFRIDVLTARNVDLYGEVKRAYFDDYDYKVEVTYKGKGGAEVNASDEKNILTDLEVKVTRNELNMDTLLAHYAEVFEFEPMNQEPYRLEDFRKKTIIIDKNLKDVLSTDIDSELIEQVGKFQFTYYFLKITPKDDKGDGDLRKYPYKNINSSNRRAWLKKFGGVKIFRDNFRIRPYGENGEDWLKLGERQAQSPGGPGQRLGGYKIGPNQIAGTIRISRVDNPHLQDKSGREGIIENAVFELFKNVIKEMIAFFEKDRNVIMFHLSQLSKRRFDEAEAIRKAQEEAERIKNEEERTEADKLTKEREEEERKAKGSGHQLNLIDYSNETSNAIGGASNVETLLAKGVRLLTEKSDKQDEEIRLLRSLASVGLIISSFAHELKSLQSRLIPRTNFLLRELKNHLDENSLSHLDMDDNPYYMIQLMQADDVKLKHWLDYSLNTIKRDKRERVDLNFEEYFNRLKSTWSKALLQRNITIILKADETAGCAIRAFEVDLDSIFNNLISNSMNALAGNTGREKLIEISWVAVGDNVEIMFADNGKGLDAQYRQQPEAIFNLNETSKRDRQGNVVGTGLGLYIVKTVIEEYNDSSIGIVNVDNGMQFKITFKRKA